MELWKIIMITAVSYGFGALVSVIQCHPNRAFDEAFRAAKELYSDFDLGFKSGVEAAQKVDSDFDAGFEAGWNSAFDAIRSTFEDGQS